ncbi:hypothetical protein TSUD_23560 [Trifolium subterraneum]|uniref:Uncharacterized protein n=1 Tax=Trifolium subterraneum TaxID=3900 RepID=A0A2Z6MYP4_TRISU|nr:hypothetical protein TSUD_23560 [Trifolium subterraneum]
MNLENEYPAMEILARVIRQVRDRILREIVDSRGSILSDHILTGIVDSGSLYVFQNSEVTRLSNDLDKARRIRYKAAATFNEISYNLNEAIRERPILGNWPAITGDLVFLPEDNLPFSHD